MPVNWGDPNDVQAFKQEALAQGLDPAGLDQYITKQAPAANPAMAVPVVPEIPQQDTQALTNPDVKPTPIPKMNVSPVPEAEKTVLPPNPVMDVAKMKQESQQSLTPMNDMSAQPFASSSGEMTLPQTQGQPLNQSGQSQESVIASIPAPANFNGIIPGQARVTQAFGNYNPGVEKYSRGVNLGTDFAVPPGTPLSAPPGEWKVIEAKPGFNGGSGNFVKIQNTKTGDMIGYEHLTQIGVKPGQIVNAAPVGLSGGSQAGPGRGNSTGAHASMPYQDAHGQYHDIMKSPYAPYLFGGH